MKKLYPIATGILAMVLSFSTHGQIEGCTSPSNLVTNGDFNAGNTGFTSGLTGSCLTTCSSTTYCVTDDSDNSCNSKHQIIDTGNDFMVVDGWPTGSTYQSFWGQSVAGVQAGTAYTIAFRAYNQYNNNFEIRVMINGVQVGSVTMGDVVDGWVEYSVPWSSGAISGTVSLDLHINGDLERDFAIDNIFLGTCTDCDVTSSFLANQDDRSCEWSFSSTSLANSSSTNIVGYLWDFGDGATSTDPDPTHYYSTTDNFTVCLTTYAVNANGDCCQDTYCIEIENSCESQGCEIDAEIEVVELTSCSYSFVPHVSSSSRIIGYFWDFGDGTTSNQESPDHQYTSPGNYNVCLTVVVVDSEGQCCTLTVCYEVGIEGDCSPKKSTSAARTDNGSTDMEQIEQMSLFPNPNSGSLNIKVDGLTANNGEVLIYDRTGKLIEKLHKDVVFQEGSNTLTVETAHLKPGIYILHLEAAGQNYRGSFVKE